MKERDREEEEQECLFVSRFYGPVNPMGSCPAWWHRNEGRVGHPGDLRYTSPSHHLTTPLKSGALPDKEYSDLDFLHENMWLFILLH